LRTSLVDADGRPKYTNRLIDESSPYLKQHAHNPVDWYPWGDEAFELAREKNQPVFLSIGYSTCHWCHVMEHESFDNEEIASYLNEHFVSIKLDREQRPDLDDIYMTGVQLMGGQGGWPMSNFVTADGKPFYAGTYYPPAGFLELLQQINKVWHEKNEEVLAQAEQTSENIARYTTAQAEASAVDQDLASSAAAEQLRRLDEVNGGFGGAPKFPNESQLLIMLDDFDRRGDAAIRTAITLTLDKMYQGGIFDQVAGGFHRYSVDPKWLVPHFEKMLYNQAQLVRVYAKAAQLTGVAAYSRVVGRIADYVLRDMTSDDGRFYSATDADSEGVEGKFFVWQPQELQDCLSEQDYELVQALYQVTPEGNFEGATILNLADSLESFAADQGMLLDTLLKRLDAVHETLYQVREARERPLRDEKFITAWNGMMISSLVQADMLSGTSQYMMHALKAAEVIWDRHFDTQSRTLWRVGLESEVSIVGNLEDYAYFSEACFQLYLATADERWQARGSELIELMLERFWDAQQGGFFFSLEDNDGPMITRPKSPMDGAMPSGNSVALMAMVMAKEASGAPTLLVKLNEMISAFSGLLIESPSAFSFMLTGISRFMQGSRESVQWAAEGNLRVTALRLEQDVCLKFSFARGWHMNSNSAAADMIATRIGGGREVVYPAPSKVKVEFSELPLEVFEDEFEVLVKNAGTLIDINFQSCSDTMCLKPESLLLRVPV
jgi:uncharacterized protein YyaL (SSP411 family)